MRPGFPASYMGKMASNRIIPPGTEQLKPQSVPDPHVGAEELQHQEERKVNRALRTGSVAQIVIALAVVLAVCYVAKLVLVTLLDSILSIFIRDPVGAV